MPAALLPPVLLLGGSVLGRTVSFEGVKEILHGWLVILRICGVVFQFFQSFLCCCSCLCCIFVDFDFLTFLFLAKLFRFGHFFLYGRKSVSGCSGVTVKYLLPLAPYSVSQLSAAPPSPF